jgi:hypothetical protein
MNIQYGCGKQASSRWQETDPDLVSQLEWAGVESHFSKVHTVQRETRFFWYAVDSVSFIARTHARPSIQWLWQFLIKEGVGKIGLSKVNRNFQVLTRMFPHFVHLLEDLQLWTKNWTYQMDCKGFYPTGILLWETLDWMNPSIFYAWPSTTSVTSGPVLERVLNCMVRRCTVCSGSSRISPRMFIIMCPTLRKAVTLDYNFVQWNRCSALQWKWCTELDWKNAVRELRDPCS